ncbi:unannotated protein [freshwater metagenome]|uniref:Unannotated protein n=1 Tax=freshwater metagenome TaxID=449393 RepID=A0A6J7FMH8_9ZZZZ|nr:spore gernimation protein [Actinomycetota bacterium]
MSVRRFLPLLVAVGFIAAGCGDDKSSTAPTMSPGTSTPVSSTETVTTAPATTAPVATAPTSTSPAAKNSVLVYFLLAEQLHVAGRLVDTASPAAAVEALLAGPTADEVKAGMVSLIPAGTKLLGVDVQGHEIRVDLSGEFGTGGGSLSVMARVAQVVFTATQFPGIDTVRFSLDGSPITELTGEGYMVDGAKRLQSVAVLPLVLLEHPYQGETVGQPIRISGVSNTFEATVYYEVLGRDRAVLASGSIMATSGSGTWGTFDAELPALPAGTTGTVIVRVFDRSSENGDPVAVNEVTVQL